MGDADIYTGHVHFLLHPSFVVVFYFGTSQIVVERFRGGIGGKKHVQVLSAIDPAVSHQSAICVGST